ncbi:hypothetical protein QQF64_013646 [Cirrhinus molitorella]|uniref:Uncharacterized protein n=1 Tax=Cirrhinus molitorella TaxID=172907 RepID=A0ABR3LT12_9TELE
MQNNTCTNSTPYKYLTWPGRVKRLLIRHSGPSRWLWHKQTNGLFIVIETARGAGANGQDTECARERREDCTVMMSQGRGPQQPA